MKRLAIAGVRAAGHAGMAPFEHRLMRAPQAPAPPVFIIGAPRSGTSLLYELMITRFRFAYMANAAHRFYRTPLAATHLFRQAIERWRGDFTSRYGHIEGWGAPNEGGWIWQRWLPDADWDDGRDLDERTAAQLRSLLDGFAELFGAPFLNKNVMHSNRLRLMNRIWPNAVFVEVERDVLDNARSIVRAERASGGPEKHGDDWWSVRPRLAGEFAGGPDTARAVAQVIGVARDIAADMAEIGEDRLLRVRYDLFCAAPEAALVEIAAFLARHGCPLTDRFAVPESFPQRPARPLEPADETVLQDVLSKLS